MTERKAASRDVELNFLGGTPDARRKHRFLFQYPTEVAAEVNAFLADDDA
jgi:hypothetical protein